MRQATSGSSLPTCHVTFPVASQGIAANAAYAPAHVACVGADPAGGPIVVSARTALPRTAGGASPNIEAWSDAAGFISFRISNNNANALVATGADVIVDAIQFPTSP
jgi:hypothetical protein